MKNALAVVLMGSAMVCGVAQAADSVAKAEYKQAEQGAGAAYKAAHLQCESITGNPKDVCIAEAKAVRVQTEQEAEAKYKDTVKAYTQARTRIADANYDLAKTKCKDLRGNDEDVCVKQAKSVHVAALADAKADKKVIEARADAREDKRSAEYKVAREKCDALSGPAKDSCVAAAKSQFGK